MTDAPTPPPETDPLWAQLREFWEATDPVPAGLSHRVLAAIAVEDLDTEFELMRLLDSTADLAGARSVGDATGTSLRTSTIQFTHDRIELLLRVSVLDEAHRRVDGWIAPPLARTVTLRRETQSWEVASDASGRFEFPSVPVGPVRLWLHGTDDSFTTTMFEL
ncbi:hypothetical protein [Flexivirga caeni]|uniref:Carboxypeptidase regulatory-like domain-containing protein n=1 Tax=Flexivirga caeni TaxID=2294115 RepID=A0A3M9MIB1_9MICO|nr:hypothetical protein [Flexivirga caeni]RNI25310.1 hypothetical protein EFY87_01365 [Flexivirga caeni]